MTSVLSPLLCGPGAGAPPARGRRRAAVWPGFRPRFSSPEPSPGSPGWAGQFLPMSPCSKEVTGREELWPPHRHSCRDQNFLYSPTLRLWVEKCPACLYSRSCLLWVRGPTGRGVLQLPLCRPHSLLGGSEHRRGLDRSGLVEGWVWNLLCGPHGKTGPRGARERGLAHGRRLPWLPVPSAPTFPAVQAAGPSGVH